MIKVIKYHVMDIQQDDSQKELTTQLAATMDLSSVIATQLLAINTVLVEATLDTLR